MSRDINGDYTLPSNDSSPAAPRNVIRSSDFNELTGDIATALTDSWSRSGKGKALADLDMDGNDFLNSPKIDGAAQKAQNLADLANKQTSRINLGLETRQVTDFGAVGDCTAVGVGTDDTTAIADALAWVHGGNYRRLEFAPGKRWRVTSAIVSGTDPVVGSQIIMESPITPDTGAFTAITIQNMRDCYVELQVYEGGQDADYSEAAPAGGSQAFRIKGCRHICGEITANSYLGRVLLDDCVGGYFKNSFHELFIRCGDRSEAFLAVPCGQAIYVLGPTTALGWYSFNSAWTKYGNVFDSVVDIAIPYAEFGPLNTDVGANSTWEFRGCGSVWLGQILGGDETFVHTLMKFTTNTGGTGCRRVNIDTFFSVGAQNAIIFEDFEADDNGILIKNLISRQSAGPAVMVSNVPKICVLNHDSVQDYQGVAVVGPVGYLEYHIQADDTEREAISVSSGATGIMHFHGRSKDASQETINTYAHAKIDETAAARIDFIDFIMQGTDPIACFDIAGTSGSNGVRILGGRYETTTKFENSIEASSIDNAQGIVGKTWGTATIANGTSSIVVSHGLFNTPSYVLATGNHAETSDVIVTNKTTTQFTLSVPSNVTAARTVDWNAIRRP